MSITTKVCKTCKIEKSTNLFNKRKDGALGVSTECRECYNSKRKSRSGNPKVIEYRRKYYRENREKIRTSENSNPLKKQKRKEHYLRNKQSVAEQMKVYRAANRDKFAYLEGLRRSSKLKATPKWLSEDQLREISDVYYLARDLSICTGEQYHVDHIIPLKGEAVCGLHVPWNLQVLPSDINIRKSNKMDY